MATRNTSQRGATRRSSGTAVRGRSGSARASAPRTRTRAAGAPRAAAKKSRTPARPTVRGPWVPLAVVGVLLVLAWVLYPALKLQYQQSRRVADLQRQYTALQQRNRALRSDIADLKTPEGVEKAARENLGMARSGENVYVVMDASGTPRTAADPSALSASADPYADDRGPVRILLDAIFGVAPPVDPSREP